MTVKGLVARVENIAEQAERDANELIGQGRPAEAKAVLTTAQRDLRDVRRDALDEQREVRERAADARLDIGKQGQIIGLFTGSKGRGHLARGRAHDKRKLAQRQADALRPYDALKSLIDRTLANLERAKAEVSQAAADDKAARRAAPKRTSEEGRGASPETIVQGEGGHGSPAPPVAPPVTPAMWAHDPSGRHELRYWDGARWSVHVSDQGVMSQDAL